MNHFIVVAFCIESAVVLFIALFDFLIGLLLIVELV